MNDDRGKKEDQSSEVAMEEEAAPVEEDNTEDNRLILQRMIAVSALCDT